jgi:hypothetical protein
MSFPATTSATVEADETAGYVSGFTTPNTGSAGGWRSVCLPKKDRRNIVPPTPIRLVGPSPYDTSRVVHPPPPREERDDDRDDGSMVIVAFAVVVSAAVAAIALIGWLVTR